MRSNGRRRSSARVEGAGAAPAAVLEHAAAATVRAAAQALYGLITRQHRDVVIVTWPRQRIVSFGFGPKKMSQHYAYIGLHAQHANLGFYRGASLKDPAHLLEGTGKLLRHIKVTSPADVRKAALRALLKQARDERRCP
jgi:hypothetical protein